MSAHITGQEPSTVIAGRQYLIDEIPGWISVPDKSELDALVDWLIGCNYMSNRFFEVAEEASE